VQTNSFEPLDGGAGRHEGLESKHLICYTFNMPMILFNDIVHLLGGPEFCLGM